MTTENEALTRLANEIAVALFGDRGVPCSAWIVIEDCVEEEFGDWDDARVDALTDELFARRGTLFANDGNEEVNQPDGDDDDDQDDEGDGLDGEAVTSDWDLLSDVIGECCVSLDLDRDGDAVKYVPMLEVPSHGR